MKTILIIFLTAFTLNFATAKDMEAYQIYNSKGKKSDFDDLVKSAAEKRFVFFGEYHDNPISHWLQYELTRELYAKKNNRLVLGGEMFEADNQYIIDEYLADLISESSFQKEVRLWPNYDTDYKPLIEFAKAYQIPFIATNIPRRYASMVYKKGLSSLNVLSTTAKAFMVPLEQFEFDSTVTCYKEMIASMGGHGGVNIAIAQAIKDATMAYFILKNSTNNSLFLHYNGAYHSNNYEGIVYYLKKEIKEDKILTITTVTQKEIGKLEDENAGLADYIICVPETMTSTH